MDEDDYIINAFDAIINDKSHAFHSTLQVALNVVTNALRLYDVNSLGLSFNGGKDATITLHLLRYALSKRGLLSALGTNLKILYFSDKKCFEELKVFMNETKIAFHLNYTVYECNYKDGMAEAVNGGLKAIVMGVRKGDPYTDDAEHFTPSSLHWPAFMRIYPILHFNFHDGQ